MSSNAKINSFSGLAVRRMHGRAHDVRDTNIFNNNNDNGNDDNDINNNNDDNNIDNSNIDNSNIDNSNINNSNIDNSNIDNSNIGNDNGSTVGARATSTESTSASISNSSFSSSEVPTSLPTSTTFAESIFTSRSTSALLTTGSSGSVALGSVDSTIQPSDTLLSRSSGLSSDFITSTAIPASSPSTNGATVTKAVILIPSLALPLTLALAALCYFKRRWLLECSRNLLFSSRKQISIEASVSERRYPTNHRETRDMTEDSFYEYDEGSVSGCQSFASDLDTDQDHAVNSFGTVEQQSYEPNLCRQFELIQDQVVNLQTQVADLTVWGTNQEPPPNYSEAVSERGGDI